MLKFFASFPSHISFIANRHLSPVFYQACLLFSRSFWPYRAYLRHVHHRRHLLQVFYPILAIHFTFPDSGLDVQATYLPNLFSASFAILNSILKIFKILRNLIKYLKILHNNIFIHNSLSFSS